MLPFFDQKLVTQLWFLFGSRKLKWSRRLAKDDVTHDLDRAQQADAD